MTTEFIDIVIREKGTTVVKKRIADVGKVAQKSEKQVEGLKDELLATSKTSKLLKNALAGIGLGILIRETVQLADTYTNLQNRLRLVTTGSENLSDITQELFDVSERTRSSFAATAELYARTALATKELGLSQRETIKFTEGLNQAVILSGASAQEAQAGIIQLSQGLASGTLRGDELRSVLEQLPAVADVISKGLGVTRGELRKLGEAGKISAGIIIDAFKQAEDELTNKFAGTVPTIGQAFTVLQNSVLQLIGEFNEGTLTSEVFARGILLLAKNIGFLAKTLIVVAAATIAWQASLTGSRINTFVVGVVLATKAIIANTFASKKSILANRAAIVSQLAEVTSNLAVVKAQQANFASTASLVGGKVALATVTKQVTELTAIQAGLQTTLTRAMRLQLGLLGLLRAGWIKLSIVIAANPIGAILTAIVAVATAFFLWGDSIAFSNDGLVSLRDVLDVFLDSIGDVLSIIKDALPEGLRDFVVFALDAFKNVQFSFENFFRFISVSVDGLIGTVIGLVKVIIAAFKAIPGAVKKIFIDLFNSILSITEGGLNLFLGAINKLREKLGADPLGLVSLVKLPGGTELSDITNFGEEVKKAFLEGFEGFSVAEDALDEVLRRARENAAITASLNKASAKVENERAFQREAQRIRFETLLLFQNAREREGILRIKQIEKTLNDKLTDSQRAETLALIENKQAVKEQENILREITGPLEEYEFKLKQINVVLEDAPQLVNKLIEAKRNLDIALLDTRTDFGSGVQRGLLKLQRNFSDFATETERVLVNAFKGMEDALVDFATTGEFNFKKFADAIIKDIIRVIIRTTILRSLLSFISPTVPAAAVPSAPPTFLPANADGGLIRGVGGPKEDNLLTRISNGEFVINAASTKRFLPILEAINSGQGKLIRGKGFQNGGLVGSTTTSTSRNRNFSFGSPQNNVFSPTVNVTVEGGGDEETNEEQAFRIGKAVNAALEKKQAEQIRKQQRPGGMLNPQEIL